MWAALAELETNEDFWPTVVSRLADGEFLSTVATDLKVNHSILRNWIRGNKGREQAFVEADKQGMQARIERVRQKVYGAAIADVEAKITHADQLRAAEIMLKQSDQAKTPHSTFGDITINFVQAKDGRTIEGEVVDRVS